MAGKIQIRRDTAANWTSVNPVLADGELGYIKDLKNFRIGNGTDDWAALPNLLNGSGIWAGTGSAFTSYAKGDLIYASATDVLSKLAIGTDGDVLTLASGVPVWSAPAGGGGAFVKLDGTTPLTADWEVGTKSIIFDNGNTSAVPVNGLFMKGNNPILFSNVAGTSITRIYRDYYSGLITFQRSTDSGVSWGGSGASFVLNCGSAGSPPSLQMTYSGYNFTLSYASWTTNGPLQITAGQANGTTSLVLNGTSSGPQGAGLAIINKIQGRIINSSNGSTGNRIHTGINCEVDAAGNTTTYEAFRLNVTETALSSINKHFLLRAGKGGSSFSSLFDIYSDGKVAIGGLVPSASVHIKASDGTVNSVPLKLTTGTNVSTPEDGAFEYDGTHLYFTIGTTRNTII